MWWYLLILPMAVALWLIYEWMEHRMIQYTTTVVECRKMQKNSELRLCLITDLHNNRKNLMILTEQIRKFAPEAILLAGDLVDKHKTENKEAEAFLNAMTELSVPIYYSAGNHELSLQEKQPEAWKKYLQSIHEKVTYLENTGTFLTHHPDIFISGLSLPRVFYKKGRLQKNAELLPNLSVPENVVHIMLAHHPEYAPLYDVYQADLIVSGHLHGGLLRLPRIGGIISPRLRLPAYDAGVFSLSGGKKMFVSRGLGSHTIPLRFFNRVEVNFLVLQGTKK